MTTTTAGSTGRATRWLLSDDLYGDERSRLRWYEGIAVAATLQWIAVPWAAAVLVWVLGRPVVLSLAVIMGLMYVLTAYVNGYVKRRRVETVAVRWTPERIALGVVGGLPFVVFVIGLPARVRPPVAQREPGRRRRRYPRAAPRRPADAAGVGAGGGCGGRGRGLMAPPAGPVRAPEAGNAAGPRIRAVRKEQGLTQQGLAAAVEVSRQTIIAMETGDYAPSVYLALKIARTLRTSVEDLWDPPVG